MGNKKERFHSLIDFMCVGILAVGLIVLLTYYLDFYTWVTEIFIFTTMILLIIDSFIYYENGGKNRFRYVFLGFMFLLVIVFHLIRVFYGAYWCGFSFERLAFYFYELFAVFLGLMIFYQAYRLKTSSKRKNVYSYGVMFVGLAILLNHVVKIIIGKCI